jgi:hypothetical protein
MSQHFSALPSPIHAKLCFAFARRSVLRVSIAVRGHALPLPGGTAHCYRYTIIFHSNRPLPLLRHCPMPRNAP